MKWNFLLRRFTRPVFLFSILLVITCPRTGTSTDTMKPDHKIIFTTVTYPVPHSETNTLLLIESIRSFGGAMAQFPIWCLVPEYGKELSQPFKDRMSALNVELIPLEVDIEDLKFFFAADLCAAALAESMAVGKAHLLVWMSPNTIVLHQPSDFLLPVEKNLGYRPVHHINIGSLYDRPPDEFWTLVYQRCGVSEEQIFPMRTHIDSNTIRPYFNAGMLVIRPEKGLFNKWHETFLHSYQESEFEELYKKDRRYAIFIHQAILSGVILSSFSQNEIYELPRTYNYPIHLYAEDVTEHRPQRIEDMVTIRHEGFYTDKDWMEKIPVGESLKQWLAERIE
jgi:hypothetical protein